jgi:hypothetical protein
LGGIKTVKTGDGNFPVFDDRPAVVWYGMIKQVGNFFFLPLQGCQRKIHAPQGPEI